MFINIYQKMNPDIIDISKLLMDRQSNRQASEAFYFRILRKIISYVWSTDGRYGVRFDFNKMTGNVNVKPLVHSVVNYNVEGTDIKSVTRAIGYECLIVPIMEFPDNSFPDSYQISGHGSVKSIIECLTNIEIIKSMFNTIQNIGKMFELESGKSLSMSQSELDRALQLALKFGEIDAGKEIIRLRGVMKTNEENYRNVVRII